MTSKARDIADLGSNDVLETSSTGLDVTGTVTADGLTVENNTTDVSGTIKNTLTGGSRTASLNIIPQNDGSYGLGVQSSGGSGTCTFSFNNKATMKFDFNNDVSFYEDTGTTAKMVWDASAESLGIGTNASTIAGVNTRKDADSDVIGVYISNESTGANASSTYWNDAQGNNFYITTYGDGHTRSNETWLGSTAGSSEIVFAPNASERMRIDSSGNVGIGTASPSQKLEVASGNIELDSGYSLFLGSDSNVSINSTSSTRALRFQTGGSERARLDSSGNLLVGTTSAKSGGITSKKGFNMRATQNNTAGIQEYCRTYLGNATYQTILTKSGSVQGIGEVTIYTGYGTPTFNAGILRLLVLPNGTVSVLSEEGTTGSTGTGGIQYQWSGDNFQVKTSSTSIHFTCHVKLIDSVNQWPQQN